MHYQFSRPTPMPPITGIRANHGDLYGDIFFFDYILIDLNTNCVIEERKFEQYITNRAHIYRGTVQVVRDYAEDHIWLSMFIKLTCVEWLAFCSFTILATGCIVMLFEHFNLYFFNQLDDGSLYRSLMDIFCVTPITLNLFIIALHLYKYTLKR